MACIGTTLPYLKNYTHKPLQIEHGLVINKPFTCQHNGTYSLGWNKIHMHSVFTVTETEHEGLSITQKHWQIGKLHDPLW
jgi:hypothetical protein